MIAKRHERYWNKLRYHPVQNQLWHYTGRFAAIVAGRRSGKTDLCRKKLVLQLPVQKPWPDPIYYYILPTFAQAKRVAWKPILNLIPSHWIEDINRQDLCITCKNGSTLYVAGADKPERIEGTPSDFIMVDESSDQKPELMKTIVPMLAERDGCLYRLGVPKRDGIGKIDFREYFNRGVRGEDGIASFTWKSADILTPAQIYEAKSQMSEEDFVEQFEAAWQDIGSTVYYNFTLLNISHEIIYDPAFEIHVGCDFNVDPMCWTLSHYIDGKVRVFDEIFLRHTNTPKTLDFISNKYAGHLAGWRFYGDATSRSDKTSATKSDYYIIKNDTRFGQKRIYFPERNPSRRNRFAAVNAAFKNANGDIRICINPSCKRLINDFNMVSYQEGTTDVEDYTGTDIGHMSDAFGYQINSLMPVRILDDVVPVVISRSA